MRTPMIITSNYQKFGRGHLTHTDEMALQSRCFVFDFTHAFVPNTMIELPALSHLAWLAENQEMM